MAKEMIQSSPVIRKDKKHQGALVFTLLTLLLTGCSGVSFPTNVGSYTTGKTKALLVREYTISEIERYDAITLGFVEASYCQQRPDEPKARKAELIDSLKQRTHSLGGNGVVVEACGTAIYAGCHSYLECRGVAYQVPERQG